MINFAAIPLGTILQAAAPPGKKDGRFDITLKDRVISLRATTGDPGANAWVKAIHDANPVLPPAPFNQASELLPEAVRSACGSLLDPFLYLLGESS